jgi:hypothetical protein
MRAQRFQGDENGFAKLDASLHDEDLGKTGFSLCGLEFTLAKPKPHRLKPVLLEPTRYTFPYMVGFIIVMKSITLR